MAATFEALSAYDLGTEDLKAALLAGADGAHVAVRAATQLIVEDIFRDLNDDETLLACRAWARVCAEILP
jgi:hypothetical protein